MPRSNGRSHPLHPTKPQLTSSSSVGPPGRLAPTRRACLVALCWVAWFVHRNLTIPARLVDDGDWHRPRGRSMRRKNKLVEARIVRELPVRGLHADGTDVTYRCRPGELISRPKAYGLWGGLNGTRRPLEYPLNRTGVMDFAAHLSDMKLRMLIVGNSLGEQLHAGLEEAACFPLNMTQMAEPDDRRRWGNDASTCATEFAGNPGAQWIKDPRIVSTESGGLLGVIKDDTNMIDTKTKWTDNNTAISLLVKTLEKSAGTGESKTNTTLQRKGLLDVFVYQFQSGHVDLNDFDEYYLEQAILAASHFFRARVVIFPTIAWMNNVLENRVDRWWEVNDLIRNFARTYSPSGGSTVESVHVLDIAELSKVYIEANAKILKMASNETYALRVESMWKSLVAQMCASLPFAEDPRGCTPGMVSNDGMHLCPETVHGRINAALLCILDCKFNQRHNLQSLMACSNSCNSRYMNLDPISFPMDEEFREEISLTS